MKKYVLILIATLGLSCATTEDTTTEDVTPEATQQAPVQQPAAAQVLFEMQVHDGDKVVSNPKIKTVEGHPMSMSVNYNGTENTNFDYTWSLEENLVKLGVAIKGPQGEESFQELRFALGEATKFETPDGRYTVSITANSL
ncbi:hypothetical protein FRD01_13540 [Microvenator marinus]|jgi:hypothetical protein|uniref:Uncharacterized protein n=1 Tax=Microvenator marinus TaxID=2600177 RepID=A0A5B8XTM1_9DELT|nr:hypothetical protein [Microvenator marinus]QED28238.1 hypothetical protein FRD01_13540 [Microvenator marinus]